MAKKASVADKKYMYATGKRKSAIARVRTAVGTGDIKINNKTIDDFCKLETLKAIVMKPVNVAALPEKYDVIATVNGGGFSAQSGAVAHGIAKCLSTLDLETRTKLKKAGLLTRDSRMKERHKYGLKKARKAPQFSKR